MKLVLSFGFRVLVLELEIEAWALNPDFQPVRIEFVVCSIRYYFPDRGGHDRSPKTQNPKLKTQNLTTITAKLRAGTSGPCYLRSAILFAP